MDQLPCNLAAVFLYRNPGHCFSRSAAKIAADEFLGCWRFCAYIYGRRAAPKNYFFVCSSTPIEAAWQGEASGLLLPSSGANGGVKLKNVALGCFLCRANPRFHLRDPHINLNARGPYGMPPYGNSALTLMYGARVGGSRTGPVQ